MHAHAGTAQWVPEITDEERRVEPRRGIRLAAQVQLANGEYLQSQTVDLSTTGIGLFSVKPLSPDELCKLNIELAACGSTFELNLTASVCYCAPHPSGQHRVGMRLVAVDERNAALIRSLLA